MPAKGATAAALAADLTCWLNGEPVSAARGSLIDQLTGALDRVQLREQFSVYGSLLLWFAPLKILMEVWMTYALAHAVPRPLTLCARAIQLTAFALVLGFHRGLRYAPRGQAERQLWAIWGGYLLASVSLGPILGAVNPEDTAISLTVYQVLALLTALAFFAMAGNLWGYCALVALGFLLLPWGMVVNEHLPPLEFGAAWAAVLAWLGLKLRRLGQRAGPPTGGKP